MSDAKSVFISYSSRDIDEVNKVVKMLKEADITYWKAPEHIPAGSNYAREIPQAIKKCDVFLLIISSASQESIWIEKELDCAVNNRKTIVPLMISGGSLNEMYKFYLNNVQTIYYERQEKNALEMLKKRLKMLLGSEEKKKESRVEKMVQGSTGVVKRKKRNALTMNPQPVECVHCGGNLVRESIGIYKCLSCGKESYDYFRTIRNYLEKEGPSPIDVIVSETGIPRRNIEYLLKQELFEIPEASRARMFCTSCGAPIRTGTLCDYCKRKNGFS